MAETILLALGLLVAAPFVLAPFRGRPEAVAPDYDASDLRHRVALEALRDVEADHRAGSLDERAYARQRAEAEARAAATRAALADPAVRKVAPPAADRRGVALVAASAVALVLLVGSVLPATGLPNTTVVNQPLADARAAEAARQARIAELIDALGADPRDPATLSALADAYLAGSSTDDLVRGAVALQALIALEPDRADAYERIMTAYLRAGDAANARSAYDAYDELPTADPVELAFFDGLIALRGEGDLTRAEAAFERFLELAPDDARASMVRGLRDDAAAGS